MRQCRILSELPGPEAVSGGSGSLLLWGEMKQIKKDFWLSTTETFTVVGPSTKIVAARFSVLT